ncbi:hypothetical protein TNCV_919071 [Trichonephila clavipes]|nr:hypothetical protein TNCV_919071 [Trichonephila clavipes]
MFQILLWSPWKYRCEQRMDLETIGINDPIQKINKSKEQLKALEYLQNNMKVLSDGSFEASLPFRENASELFSNEELTLKKHKRMC